jgi:hypothetical protein
MRCMQCGGVDVSAGEGPGRQMAWSGGQECPCAVESDPVTQLLRLITLLANCGLSAGAPPVLQRTS